MEDANSLAKWVWNGIGYDTGECQYYVASRSSVSSLQTPSTTKAGGDRSSAANSSKAWLPPLAEATSVVLANGSLLLICTPKKRWAQCSYLGLLKFQFWQGLQQPADLLWKEKQESPFDDTFAKTILLAEQGRGRKHIMQERQCFLLICQIGIWFMWAYVNDDHDETVSVSMMMT
jgi:hypothetical protein